MKPLFTICAVASIVAILVGWNLRAATPAGLSADGACCWPDGSCGFTSSLACAELGGIYQGDGVTCLAADCRPRPTVVSVSVLPVSSVTTDVIRAWSDGVVDLTRVDTGSCGEEIHCGPTAIMGPACAGDVNRDGLVDNVDFLELLARWGPCGG